MTSLQKEQEVNILKGLSRTFDHVKGKNVKDFANLLIGQSDGLNIFPVISALVSSRREELVIQDFDKKVDKRKSGGRHRVDSKNRKTTFVLRYCKSILNSGIKAQYALMDTWLYSSNLTDELQELGLHSICMINNSLKFSFVGEVVSYKTGRLLSTLKKRQNLNSDIISATVVQTESSQVVKLVFVRKRNNRKEFITLLSSDTNLYSEKIVELYSRLQSIECYFKDSKQYLSINNECFGTDFDIVTALKLISYIRFIIIELIRRLRDNPRSHGQLFRECYDKLKTFQFIDALDPLSRCFNSVVDELQKAG